MTGGIIERDWHDDYQAVIVVPLTNKESTWLRFLKEHFPSKCIHTDFEEFLEAPCPRILVLHYEELTPGKQTKKGRKVDWRFVKKIAKMQLDLICFDEAHRLKNRNSGWSKAAYRLNNCSRRRLILTGTPMDERPVDLWAQFRFIAPDVLGTDFKEFEDKFMEPLEDLTKKYRRGSFMWMKMLRAMHIRSRKRKFNEEMMPEFLRLIKPHALRVTKEVLGLKPMTIVPVPVTLYGAQRRVYDELERNMISHLPTGGRITAGLKITQISKMQQVCGGYVIDEDDQVHEVGRAKLRRTLRIIKDHPKEPIVVFCRYLEEVWSIEEELEELGLRVEVITGRVKAKERPRIQDRFQNGKLDVLICQIKTGGVGIDLFRSCIAIVYSLTYSSIDFDQAVSRLHRRGQKRAVNIFLLYALGTIDEVVYRAILSKRTVIKRVLTHLKLRRKTLHGRQEEARSSQEGRLQVRRGESRKETRPSAGIRSRAVA